MYYKKLIGNKCYLSPIDLDDAPKFTEWLNDAEITKYLTLAPLVVSLASEKDILQKLCREHNYSIIDIANDRLIGNCGLMDIDHINRTAEIGIFIGDKAYHNKGYGREAMSLLIDYAFKILNLHNIMLRVYSFNERALSCYKAIGFKTMGIRRQAISRDLRMDDIVFMDLLPEDFSGRSGE